jgi:hypothetical protein
VHQEQNRPAGMFGACRRQELADQVEIDLAFLGPVFLGDDAAGILDLQELLDIHSSIFPTFNPSFQCRQIIFAA